MSTDRRAPGRGLIVGYKGEAGADVLAFARRWARASAEPVHVVTVYPGPAPIGMGRVDAEWVAYGARRPTGCSTRPAAGSGRTPPPNSAPLPPTPPPTACTTCGGRAPGRSWCSGPARPGDCAAPTPAARPSGCCRARRPGRPGALGLREHRGPRPRPGRRRLRRHPGRPGRPAARPVLAARAGRVARGADRAAGHPGRPVVR